MKIKGYREYKKNQKGQRLTPLQAIKAMCFECNGGSEGGVDCKSTTCPLYRFFPYKGVDEK